MDVTEDQLCDELLQFIEKQEQFANHLMDLATELETMTKTMTTGQFVGNTATVLGSAALIGRGIATWWTGGRALHLMAKAAGVASLTCEIVELWKSSEAMKSAEKTTKEIEEIWEKVGKNQDLQGLSRDDVGHKITATIMRTMAKIAMKKAVANKGTPVVMKAVLKGTGQVAGGALGVVFTLPDLIKNFEDLINDKHETEAITSLRTTAEEIHNAVKQLKKQFNELN